MKTKKMIKDFIFSDVANDHDKQNINDAESLIENGILDSLGIIKLLSFIESKLL